ncbi:MAG: hypothetical protein Fur002_24470 [Anaerolineales bacterium]
MTPSETSVKKLTVLIADDVQETRRNTRLMFASLKNVEVVAIASNGRQALEMTREHRPNIVVMDINMPQMDGLTAYKYIHQLYPDTGCIIISAEKDAAVLHSAAALGVQEYLIKPFMFDELESAVQRVVSRLNAAREKTVQAPPVQPPRAASLEQVAGEYLKVRRTDDQAVQVFEALAKKPQCDPHWLRTLALIYAIRQEWTKLKALAERLEKQ